MNWYALDRNESKWYPYVEQGVGGKYIVVLHHELADTDMSDLLLDELAAMLGPVTIVSKLEQ